MNRLPAYRVFGLTISSELPLFELPAAAAGAMPDVDVRFGALHSQEAPSPGYSQSADGTLLVIPKVGRYLIKDGCEIIVDPEAGASERNLRLFLLGSAFGALLHQRGLLPLHANAIVVEGRAIVFSGHSGAGKSTMAAWFHDGGYPILADDVCVVTFDETGRPVAHPGIPRLRLWREALEASGRTTSDYAPSFDDMDKYDVPMPATPFSEPVPLDQFYLLRKAADGSEHGSVTRLTGVAAIDALVSNTYRGAYVRSIGGTGPHLANCLRLARAIPIFRADRLWGFDSFEQEARRLEAHVREIMAATPA